MWLGLMPAALDRINMIFSGFTGWLIIRFWGAWVDHPDIWFLELRVWSLTTLGWWLGSSRDRESTGWKPILLFSELVFGAVHEFGDV